jgi:hypothetical protein
LIDELAVQLHEEYAAIQKKNGWTFGESFDPIKKTNPLIRPYPELLDDQKNVYYQDALHIIEQYRTFGDQFANYKEENTSASINQLYQDNKKKIECRERSETELKKKKELYNPKYPELSRIDESNLIFKNYSEKFAKSIYERHDPDIEISDNHNINRNLPFEKLDETSKIYYRKIACDLLKKIMSLESHPPNYDMIDLDDYFNRPFPLGQALKECKNRLLAQYFRSDYESLKRQAIHRKVAIISVITGVAAIFFAILQVGIIDLFFSNFKLPFQIGEFVAIIIAFIAVISGLYWHFHHDWLLQRHKAERYRLLKFRAIIHPKIWSDKAHEKENLEAWKKGLHREACRIDDLTFHDLNEWMIKETIPEDPPEPDYIPEKSFFNSLITYYRDKRLDEQIRYFDNRARKFSKIDIFTNYFIFLFFFGGVIAVLLHSLFDIGTGQNARYLSVILLTIGVMLPVIGYGIRIMRETYQAAKSSALFRAKHSALLDFDKRIKELMNNEKSEKEILKVLWECENFLTAEHKEWIRTMMGSGHYA